MQVCLFEDSFVTDLSPLNYFRHTSELICGAMTLLDKVRWHLPKEIMLSLHCRHFLKKYLEYRFSRGLDSRIRGKDRITRVNSLVRDDYVFLNSRMLYPGKFLSELLEAETSAVYTTEEQIAAIVARRSDLSQMSSIIEREGEDNVLTLDKLSTVNLRKYEVKESEGLKVLRFPWDAVLHHEDELLKDTHEMWDAEGCSSSKSSSPMKNTYISPTAEIQPQVVLDDSEGKIYVSEAAKVEGFSYIKGPVYIGEGATVRAGARLYGPVYIGSASKVSGEITHSIVHSYVNKQHLGFVGHSYLCEWVNLGAGTTTSNLKNNYSSIKVRIGDEDIDTGSIFLGSMIGDHTKTGINSMLNSGSIIGVSCNLFGSGYMPKLIRSFSWLNADSRETLLYERQKAIQTAKESMRRRHIEMPPEYEELFGYLHEKTQQNLI